VCFLGVAGCGGREPGATALHCGHPPLRLARFPRLPLPLVLVVAPQQPCQGTTAPRSTSPSPAASPPAPSQHASQRYVPISPAAGSRSPPNLTCHFLSLAAAETLPIPRRITTPIPSHPIPFNLLHLLARRYAPSRSTPPRSGSSCRRTSSPLPRGTPRQRSPSIAACSEPPPPSLGRKGPQHYGRASSRASIDSAFTAASALASTSLYCPHLPNQLVVSILSLID